jgi:hypothetical protein
MHPDKGRVVHLGSVVAGDFNADFVQSRYILWDMVADGLDVDVVAQVVVEERLCR